MKDPYKTVFIARLDYSLTELDISQYFRKFGVIDSILIIRDHQGKAEDMALLFMNETLMHKHVFQSYRVLE